MNPRMAILVFALSANYCLDCAGATRELATETRKFVTTLSRSGQFTVQGLPASKSLSGLAPPSDATYVRVDATLLCITAENIKQALLSVLETTDRWQSSITVSLHPVQRDGEEIVIASVRSRDGWTYRVGMPELVDKRRLTRALVEVLLLEMAQRSAGERRLELPPWLVPGLGAHLEANAAAPLIMEPETFTNRKRKLEESVKTTRETLRSAGGLTLDDLNWPTERIDPVAYEASAHLFVRELLRKGGGAPFNNMLSRLRDHYNWQTVFLQAFGFQSLRDVDKWWTLRLVQFAGRDSLSIWSTGEVNAQLMDVLNTTVQVRRATNELPVATQVPLDRVLQEWDFARQQTVLGQKLVQLDALRLRAPTNFVGVVVGYQRQLSAYVGRRQRIARPAEAPIVKSLVKDTLQKLGELDVRREIAVSGASGTAALKPE
jgi:hypothetical protein